MFSPISVSFSPNTQKDDVNIAFKLLFQWGSWSQGKYIEKLERAFKDYFKTEYSVSLNSGRSALIAVLAGMGVGESDEVLIQGFTCNAAVNPISSLKAVPVFVDIDEELNLDPKDLESKISSKSRAVMIQHTFGNPAEIERIRSICKENNLFLIEDCAHSLGAEYKESKIGTFSDAAFFSFGRDKIISSVYGGMAITNNIQIGQKLEAMVKSWEFPEKGWTLKQILHPLVFSISLPVFYFCNIGKGILFLCRKLNILSPSVYEKEKQGKLPKFFPKKMPNALARIALNQFSKLEKLNNHRKELAQIYRKELSGEKIKKIIKESEHKKPVYMRYPILIEGADEIRKKLKKEKIILDGGWHGSSIIPPDTNLEKVGYKKGECGTAEAMSRKVLNLPTNIHTSKEEARKVIEEIERCKP